MQSLRSAGSLWNGIGSAQHRTKVPAMGSASFMRGGFGSISRCNLMYGVVAAVGSMVANLNLQYF